jgi:hypothetical protein
LPDIDTTFDLLADAAGVRYPDPDRENRGLCPAHDDHNNPGLVFRISPTTGNIIVHCFARECSAEDIATSIGVPLTAFFPGNTSPGQVRPTIIWKYTPVLELLKLLPLGYSWEDQIEAVFRTMEADEDTGCLGLPFHEVPFTVMRDVLLFAYTEPDWRESGAEWWNNERTGYSDQAMRALSQLSRETRTNDLSQESTIPRSGR